MYYDSKDNLMTYISALSSWSCTNQPVFLRADLNVPLKDGIIMNDRRLRATQPTLDCLLKQNAIIILATHIGRPKGHEEALSTKHLMPWLAEHGYQVTFCPTVEEAKAAHKNAQPGSILLMENLRFFKEEQTQSIAFAQQLASLAHWYVDDAFGALHRHDTSIALLPEQFAPDKRTFGFLVEQELNILHSFLSQPAHPVSIILGGNKVETKVPLLKNTLAMADHILLCPAIVFTFLKALGKPIGTSLVDDHVVETARAIIDQAPKQNCTIHFPVDYQVAEETINGPLSIISADQFPENAVGISIGPKTQKLFAQIIRASQTSFFNGAIGFTDRPATLQGMESIFGAMADSHGVSLVTGGDSLAALDELAMGGITYTITGGGAALAYLGGEKLPGLEPFRS